MRRDVEHVGIALEEMLGPVAVVEIPVDDEHTGDAAPSEMRGGDGDVVEEAEPHRPGTLRMVARRPYQRHPVVHLSGQDRVAQLEQSARRQARGLPRAGGGAGVGVEDHARPARGRRNLIHQPRRVHQGDLVRGRQARPEVNQTRRVPEVVVQHAQAIGALRVSGSWIMRQHPFIEDDPGTTRHRPSPSRSHAPEPAPAARN